MSRFPVPPAGASSAPAQPADAMAMSIRPLDRPYDALQFTIETMRPHVQRVPDGQQRLDWLEWLTKQGANFASEDPVLLVAFARLALKGEARSQFLIALRRMDELVTSLEQPQPASEGQAGA